MSQTSRRQIATPDPATDVCSVCGATMDTHFKVQGTRRLWKGCGARLAAAQRAQRRDQTEAIANILANTIAAQHGLVTTVSVRMADLAPDRAATFRRAAAVALGMLDSVSEDIARYRARTAAGNALLTQLAVFIDTDDHADELRQVAAVVAEYTLAAYISAFEVPSGAVQSVEITS